MTWINRIDSFAEAEARYAGIKPMVSINHTKEQDVRPLGKRARKWERIIRVDPNTYALTCGGFADPVFCWGPGDSTIRTEYPVTPDEIARLSPIVWRKHKDGTETITIRNGAGEWQHNTTYAFLNRALPRELWFKQTRIGKQFIYNRSKGQTVHLPKTTSAPRHVIEYYKARMKERTNPAWLQRWAKAYTAGDDGLSVTFKREENGTFTLVGEPHKVMVKRTRMNKELKGPFKADIADLFKSAMAFYPMMRAQLIWSLKLDTDKEMYEIAAAHNIKGYGPIHGRMFRHAEPALVQAILKDPEHPMRHGLNIAAMFAIKDAVSYFDSNRDRYYADKEEEDKARNKAVRAHFNKWISTLGGFTVTTKEEK